MGWCAAASEQIDAPLLPPEGMAEPKSVRLGFVTGVVAVEKLQAWLAYCMHAYCMLRGSVEDYN